jgi:hypothetical protein
VKNLTAKLTAIIGDKLLSKTTSPNSKNEQIKERSGGSVTGEAEKSAKCTFAKDVLYSVYASHLESDEEASRGAEAACSLR